jgi:(S)-3,5-dihydroxyphenylglycine transaminase
MATRSLDDYARLAGEGVDPGLVDLLAHEERASATNLAAFDRIGLRQGRSATRGAPDTTTKLFGCSWTAPLVVGSLAGLARPDSELAMVEAAGAAGLPAVVTAFAGRTFADLSKAAAIPLWLQTYPFRDRATARRLVGRAEEAKFGALLLALGGTNNVRLAPGTVPINLQHGRPVGDVPALLDAAVDWSEVAWLRSVSSLPLIVGGVRTTADALHAVEAGAYGIVVTALDAAPEIAAALAGRCSVLLAGGVRQGADVLAALASGADAAVLGQPVLDGLLIHGGPGMREVLDNLVREFSSAMVFTGIGSTAEAGPELIRTGRPSRGATTGQEASHNSPGIRSSGIRKSDLHASVSDPTLDTMTFLNEVTLRYPDAISFAPGRPYDGFFDNEQIFAHVRRYLDYLAEQGSSPEQIRTSMYQYGPTAGQIREIIADSLRADENIDVPAESIVVTVGAQEAMLLVLRALIAGPDDVLLVASPCYVGITGAARLLDIAVTPVVEREDGFSSADLEAAIMDERARGRHPRAFYVVPDHSNPSGTTIGSRARVELLEVARRHDLLILEDSPYRMVSPGSPLPTLKSLDAARTVVHLGSFSKTVFPGARVGFAIADQRVVDEAGRTSLLADELAKIKSMVTVNTSSLSQAVVAGTLLAAGGRISTLNANAASYYGDAMQCTLRHLDERLPADRRAALGVRWNKPSGGFFLAVQVPFLVDDAALTRSAQDFGVIWTPMKYFYPAGGGHYAIRLSVSYLTPAEIQEGVARLARFIEAMSEPA